MLGDLTEKIQASQSKFEQLADKIPGYAGYRQKEQRRDADKLLRMHVAGQYEELIDRINRVQYELVSAGDMTGMMLLERSVTKLQLLVDRIATASYGYAGLFDALKVDEDVLDRMYEFDQAMLEGVSILSGLVDEVESAAGAAGPVQESGSALVQELERLHRTFSERQQIILS